MSLFDFIGIDPSIIVERFAKWNIEVSVNLVSRILDVLSFVFVVATTYCSWKALTYKSRKYIRVQIGADYKRFNSSESRRLYINTKYLDAPPNDFDNPQRVIKGKNLLKLFNKSILDNDDADRLHLILGGSGMGKSSFLVALLRNYVRSNPFRRKYDIVLIDLGRGDCLERIDSIHDKGGTILLLDALDECRDASVSFENFMSVLEEKIEDFAMTIITCRTQFFSDEASEPRNASIVEKGKYKGKLKYHKYYISYFDNWDVRCYLFKKFGLNIYRLLKANKAIGLCNSIEHRPLLLSYIDDLITGKAGILKTELDLYECLINFWLKRETESLVNLGISDVLEKLFVFSQRLAVKMYKDYNQKKDYYVTGEEALSILSSIDAKDTMFSFKSRSLIERDSEGKYKFAHRTFLEYFLAIHTFSEDGLYVAYDGLDMVWVFFRQLCERHIHQQEKAHYIEFGQSEHFSQGSDRLEILNHRGGFKLKSILPLSDVKVLSFDYRLLSDVLLYIDQTSIRYLQISGYRNGESINAILDHPNIKYLWICGGSCSKAFLKKAQKLGVSVIINGELVLFSYSPDCPMDFLAPAKLSTTNVSSSLINYIDFSNIYD